MKYHETMKRGAVSGLLALTLLTPTLPATKTEAATLPELQAQIQALLMQIESLRNGTTSGPATCFPFTSNLSVGRSGPDVTRLQQFLIQNGVAIPAGATGYFGEQTRQAVATYQRTHGISPASGTFGPITRAKVNVSCTTAPVTTTPTRPTTPPPTTTPSTPTLNGEAELTDFTFTEGDDMTLEEGDQNRVLGEIEFSTEDGDATLQRVDVVFTPNSSNNEKDPWDTFSEVSIWDGNERLARIDSSKKSAWRNENRTTGAWTLRISGLDYTLEEDTDTTLTLNASIAKSIRGIADGENWSIHIPQNGVRALDADRTVIETGDSTEQISLDLEEAGATDELLVRTSTSDPDSTTLILDRSKRSGFTTVFAFDLDTDDSVNDIEIRRLPIELTVGTSTLNTFVRDARITIDGKTYTRKTITDGATGTITFEFRSNELVIDAGDRVTGVLEIDFKPLPANLDGTSVEARLEGAQIVAEGADDLSTNQLAGTVTSETHILQASGSVTAPKGTSATVTSQQGSQNDYASYRISVEVTAVNQDVYIPIDTSAAVTYQIRDTSGNELAGTSTAIVSSNAREQGNYFFIPEGETKTLTLDVTYQPQTPLTSARLRLLSIGYAATPTTPDQTWLAAPAHRYETSVVTIVD